MQNLKLKFKIKLYSKTFYFLLVFLTFEFLFLNLRFASAQTMSNDDYIIKMQGFNATSGVNANSNYNLRSTTGGYSPASSEGVNYKVATGFENLEAALPFSVSLSSSLIDFGILSPTNPIIRTLDLNINSSTTYGYSVLAFENESLAMIPPTESGSALASKIFIPDTTCDSGLCGIRSASEWTNILTYGFGYRCDNLAGTGCDNSFNKTGFYKRLPNISNNDDPAFIMAGFGSDNQKVRLSYKVNISGTQSPGTYSNVITYIAVPNF